LIKNFEFQPRFCIKIEKHVVFSVQVVTLCAKIKGMDKATKQVVKVKELVLVSTNSDQTRFASLSLP
jgi:hypothetical protein